MGPENSPALTSSNSFRVDHRAEMTSGEMVNDVETYIYEFRLKAQKKDYDLSLTLQDGIWRLGDPVRNEPMATKAHRALMDRKLRGKPTHREEAEFAGITFLEQQLANADVGDSIIWFSPPGPEEEGYGDYGFGFTGEVVEDEIGKKTVKMTANRFEKPILEQYKQVFRLFTGADFNAQGADDFLRMPIVIGGGLNKQYIDMIFANIFGFFYDEAEAIRIDDIYKTRIEHLALEYSLRYPNMSPAERIAAVHAMENIATEAKKYAGVGVTIFSNDAPRNLNEARSSYDYEPEKVAGSCPVTKSNNPFASSIFSSAESFSNGESCSACGRSKEDNHYHCPDCRKSYADETEKTTSERTKKCTCGFKFGC